MKQILLLFGKGLIRQFLSPPRADGMGDILAPVKEYVEDSVRRYALLAGFAFIFTLYFVAGTLMMITAAAESFDSFGFFAPGILFYSGAGITVTALAALAGCYIALRRHRHKHQQIAKQEMPADSGGQINMPDLAGTGTHWAHLAEAVLTGVISGMISRRFARAEGEASLRERIRRVI